MAEASIQTANMFPDPQFDMEGSNNGVSKRWDIPLADLLAGL